MDEAIAVGWIDGVIRSLDAHRYAQRFTPRKAGSTWSVVNVRKAEALTAAGRMRPVGQAAFARRTEAKAGIYSHEQAVVAFAPAQEAAFRRNMAAWRFFEAQSGSYRRAVTWWVTSARREETRRTRLRTLIEHCADGRPLRQFSPRPRRTPGGRTGQA